MSSHSQDTRLTLCIVLWYLLSLVLSMVLLSDIQSWMLAWTISTLCLLTSLRTIRRH